MYHETVSDRGNNHNLFSFFNINDVKMQTWEGLKFSNQWVEFFSESLFVLRVRFQRRGKANLGHNIGPAPANGDSYFICKCDAF